LGLDAFRKGALISEGGMAMVYRATEISTGRACAWKEAASSRFNPLEEVNGRLRDEADALRSLNHPRIPKFVAQGPHTNPEGHEVEVLVMDYIDVPSLKQELESLFRRGVTEGLGAAQQTLSQVCEALEYMADQDPPMFHRDIKPANIMVDPSKGAILIDFGLAKGVSAGVDVSLSRGASEGWSPPERRDGISGGFTDVFSLGQVLWHMLTGERPFHALTEEEISEKLVEKGHPEWVAGLIFACAQRRDRRIGTSLEFRLRLENEGAMPGE
jgi:serine/threonine-protein kinase